ncbi:MAG: hypothetical protein ACK4IX_16505 [Candidatus Sericytochromatia bacterium]
MKKLLPVLALTFILSSCASNDIQPSLIENNVDVQAQSVEKNMLEKFEGYYSKPNKDSFSQADKNLSQMLMKVKSLTGQQKYDNGKTVSKYYLYANDDLFGHGTIRLGKDGKIYFEDFVSNGTYQYCEIGTYTKLSSDIKDGDLISFKLNSNFKMDYKGQGLNPMAHSSIRVKTNSDANIKPIKKSMEEFI